MARIIVIGGVNMDLHLFDVRESAGQAPRVAGRYLAQPGGKGANVARAAARLGAQVSLVARVGDDEFGRDCVTLISNDAVDTRAVAVTPHEATGFVAIEISDGRHRSLLFVPGANDHLTWADVEPNLSGLEPDDVVVVQAEVPSATLEELAAFSTRTGTRMFLDPTPPDRVTHEVIAAAEVITPDRAEAAALVGRADTSSLWPELAAKELLEAGAQRVIVKTGETGAVLADGHHISRVPTLSVDALDETGAGDVFLAALAVRRSEGVGWEEATRFANVASALSIATDGLMLPQRDVVEKAAVDLGPQ